MLDPLRAEKEKTMKRKGKSNSSNGEGENIRREYKIDYGKSRPNRFVKMATDEPLVVMVDSDVARVFTNAESVNRALRALIAAMPRTSAKRVAR